MVVSAYALFRARHHVNLIERFPEAVEPARWDLLHLLGKRTDADPRLLMLDTIIALAAMVAGIVLVVVGLWKIA